MRLNPLPWFHLLEFPAIDSGDTNTGQVADHRLAPSSLTICSPFLFHICIMSVWNVAPVDSQPELTLIRRQMIEVQLPDITQHYLVGYCLQNNEGRVTSAVSHFNPRTLTAVTHSGRTYQLSGPPGNDRDACYVCERLAANSGITEWTDTAEQIWLGYERTQMTAAA